MTKHQLQVKEFHSKYGVLINETPIIPSEEILKLRCKLIVEEVLEFCQAAGLDLTIYTNWESPSYSPADVAGELRKQGAKL